MAPVIEGKWGSDPTIEAAKIAANSFFSKPGSSQSARADQSDSTARESISRLEPALAADVAVQKPAVDLAASPLARSVAQEEKPRSRRVLQSLIVEDPIDALLRREDEERSARRRPRGPRAKSVVADGTGAAVLTGSGQIAMHKMSGKRSANFMESRVSPDIGKPGRKSRGRKAATDPNPGGGAPSSKAVKKKEAKARGLTGSPRRTANEGAEASQRAHKRADTNTKGIAKSAAAKIGKAAFAKKTTRKGEAKGSRGIPTLAKKRSAARRSATTLPGRKLAPRKIGKRKGQ